MQMLRNFVALCLDFTPGTGNIKKASEHEIIVKRNYTRKNFPTPSIFYLIFIFTTHLNVALLSVFIVTANVPSNFWLRFFYYFIKTLVLMILSRL